MTFSDWSVSGPFSSGFSVAHIGKFFVLTHLLRWKWTSSVHKIFHSHSQLISMRTKNSKARVSLAGRSTESNPSTWLILYENQCRMVRRTLFTVFTGILNFRAISPEMLYCISFLYSCCTALVSSSTVFDSIRFLSLPDFRLRKLFFEISEYFSLDPRQSSDQYFLSYPWVSGTSAELLEQNQRSHKSALEAKPIASWDNHSKLIIHKMRKNCKSSFFFL